MKRDAEQYEREVREAILAGTRSSKEDELAVPTFASFAAYFIDTDAATNNRPSTVREKRRTLGRGMLDELGHLCLDQIGPRQIEAFKARRKRDGVGHKTINEELAILGQPRIVDLPRKAATMLRAHQHIRGPFVFCREDGAMLQRWECESKSKDAKHDGPLAKVARKAGLRRIGWHVLRHTYASHLMMRGAKPVEVQELLGHASLTMTMRYAHLSPSARRAAAELLDAAPPRHHSGTAKLLNV